MPTYPLSVTRCQHLKPNGIQCGSPSLRDQRFCFYHIQYHYPDWENLPDRKGWVNALPTLEDANSIQIQIANVVKRLLLLEIDHKSAGLLLYALQTASINLKGACFEPELPTQVVIDRASVAHRPLGASAWSKVEGREYDDLTSEDPDAGCNAEDHPQNRAGKTEGLEIEARAADRRDKELPAPDRQKTNRPNTNRHKTNGQKTSGQKTIHPKTSGPKNDRRFKNHPSNQQPNLRQQLQALLPDRPSPLETNALKKRAASARFLESSVTGSRPS